ncbi:MAG TPA: helix-turn-helix domain-containing protein [Solirubrobacteraceae bacterium]|nr:helix-turn-helix domain-containing protein [Solirubrobacteraceae bacterium]
MSTPVATPERPLRRDAERNRQRIIDAARIVFAERGLRASHDDIAREAQVGVGTVYRRFPDKEQLIDALFEEAMERIAAIAEEALAMEDPWEGLVHFIVGGQELQCADRGLKELMLSNERGAERVAQARSRILPLGVRLMTRAQEAGVVRDDISFTDVPLLQIGVGAITDATRDVAPETWRRTLTILLDGLRASRDTTRPLTQPPLSLEQFDTVMQAGAPRRR